MENFSGKCHCLLSQKMSCLLKHAIKNPSHSQVLTLSKVTLALCIYSMKRIIFTVWCRCSCIE